MTLMPLSGYSVQTDTVHMCSCVHTADGRIYLGAADGHIYEIDYGKRGRCRKVSVTATVLTLLSAVVPRMLTGHSPSAVTQMVVDGDRHFLFAVQQPSSILVCFSPVLQVVVRFHSWYRLR
jgi:nuclear pore complex protein Nup155